MNCLAVTTFKNVSHQGERRTENHWHSRPEPYLVCY